jgi:hypothetical protein
LKALVDISLVDIEEGIAKEWHQRDEAPSKEGETRADVLEFMELVLRETAEANRPATAREMAEYYFEEPDEVEEAVAEALTAAARPARADNSAMQLPNAHESRFHSARLAIAAKPWAQGGVGFETHYWS